MTGQRERLVIVGNGMASVRLVERLVARGYPGLITVLGDEPSAPYNRILLSALLEGVHDASGLILKDPSWYAAHGIDLRIGARVLTVDRAMSDVMLVDGTLVPFDKVVLATGSIPTLPPIRGLVRMDGQLHESVHAFRSLADCTRLDDAIPHARRAVVVGGGLLGLQVARALSLRGLAVEVVEGADHVLASQVSPAAGLVLQRDLARLGTAVYTGARAIRITDEGLRLDNGYVLDTDLVVLTAGGRPALSLARNAGLAFRRGILVGDQLQSPTDPRVHALGDCAEHAGRTTGFVSPAWEQAVLLADHLCGDDVTYTGARVVARLRATDLDVAVLGDPERTDGEVVEFANPLKGSHRKLVVKDDVIVAGALVGDLSSVGLITQLYDRGTRIGRREAGELLMPVRTGTPPVLPDDAEVCACAGVTAGAVRACADVTEARATTRATTGCGGCLPTVSTLVRRGDRVTIP